MVEVTFDTLVLQMWKVYKRFALYFDFCALTFTALFAGVLKQYQGVNSEILYF